MAREVYHHVPDLSWAEWHRVARPLSDLLARPRTTGEIVAWSLGPKFDVDGQRMGASRRTSYVRNMLAWLSSRGEIAFSGGKWRRIVRRESS